MCLTKIDITIKGEKSKMVEAIAMFGWTFIILVGLAFLVGYVGDNLND
mgnify:CR=1 FL=1|jgi:hypothetical protein|tara:strand:+ start:177 stop:320 length:144 start_codon:yes stop_codon:yes gene_type:complete